MTFQPLFSVIIPTYHRNDVLATCLDCLSPQVQTLPADRYEVIVSDDGRDSTAEALIREHYPWVKWVAGPGRGPASNRNHGATFATGDWLVFTDDDCQPDANWLSAFAAATTGEVLALEGAIHPIGDPNQDLVDCPVNLTGGYFWSANIAVKRSLFEQIGGFDSSYPLAAHEDQDLLIRLQPLTPIPFVATAVVSHPVRSVPLHQAIQRTVARCHAWAHHVIKNQTQLGYKNRIHILWIGYHSQLMHLLRSLLRLKYKQALVAIFTLIVGLPMTSKTILLE